MSDTSLVDGGSVDPGSQVDTIPTVTVTPPQPLGVEGGRFAAGGGLTPHGKALPPDEQPSSYGDIFDAILPSTTTAAAIRFLTKPQYHTDPTYNPIEDPQIMGTQYESDYLSNFVGSRSAEESASIISEINAENGRTAVFQRGGVTGFMAGLAAGVLDPTMLIPISGWIKGGVAVGRVARMVRGASDAAIGSGIAAGIQEAELHGFTQTRTADNSLYAIGGSVLIGRLLGGPQGRA